MYHGEVKAAVYPSMIELTWPDGSSVTIDVGVLYPLFAAHLHQNGLWNDLDWRKVMDRIKAKIDVGQMSFQPDGTVAIMSSTTTAIHRDIGK
jgi:hypothetical protein